MFRYHEYRSKKLNAWRRWTSRMIYLTCTQKSCCIYKLYIAIFKECTAIFIRTNPLHQQQSNPALLAWRASFFVRGDVSTLVSDLPTTVPPLGFYPSHPFTPHSSNYISYIDNISVALSGTSNTLHFPKVSITLCLHHSKNHWEPLRRFPSVLQIFLFISLLVVCYVN